MHSPYQKQQSQPNVSRYMGIFVLMIFVFLLGWNIGINQNSQSSRSQPDIITNAQGQSEVVNMELFWNAWNVLSGHYVDPSQLDTQEMVYGAIRGMVASIGDPYTTFLTPKENSDFQSSLSGNFGGIGAELTFRDNQLTVVSPLKDSPAKEMGILPQDIIVAINQESTEGMSLEEAAGKIRGETGTQVVLTLFRDGADELFDLSIERKIIHVNSVEWEMKQGAKRIAWIELNTFGDETKKEFAKVVSEILSASPDGVILDLRFNGGGYLDGAVDIASEFLNDEKIVTIKERNPQNDKVYYANGQGRMLHLPMVVLVNTGSASASEIVAGALQDHKRAVIIGEPSFGKSTVQNVESLKGGSSIRVTTAKWFTPKDRDIGEAGVEPDLLVERTVEDYNAERDPQLDAAIEHFSQGDF